MGMSVIHQTDLFHHFNDPDDHWDLACQFALSYAGDITLKNILLDYPPVPEYGDPAIAAVQQLSYITGLSVPVTVGTKAAGISGIDLSDAAAVGGGVSMLLRELEASDTPVFIQIVGSCKDVALAGKINPDLFRRKCGGIYLNAGAAWSDQALEYNVALDPDAFDAVFDIPCPIFWAPCFDTTAKMFEGGTYGTFYRFTQGEILPYVSDALQKYFAYALGCVMDPRWLSYLALPKNEGMLRYYCEQVRHMWCTAGFLHCAGKTVAKDGSIVPNASPVDALFSFEPIEATCGAGRVTWTHTDRPTNRYIFKINHIDAYAAAMTKAMKSLLMQLPECV